MVRKYCKYIIILNSGVHFSAQVSDQDRDGFIEWLDSVPGVTQFMEAQSEKFAPRSKKKSKIAMARINAGLTQQELADRLGVFVQQEQRWENGVSAVRATMLMRISEILGVDIKELIED